MFDKLKNIFSKKEPVVVKTKPTTESKPKKPRTTKKKSVPDTKIQISDKEKATLAGEPYISIVKVDVDPNNINAGSFELDWNDKFVINLVKAGYKQREEDTDQIVVDRWFQTVCRNIALEVYEQQAADPKNSEYDELRRVQSRDIGNGRTEVS